VAYWNFCTAVFDRKDCYYDTERDLLAIAKFLVFVLFCCSCEDALRNH